MGRYEKNGIMTGPWFDDFSVIPKSIHEEFAAAVLDNNKIVELNTDFFVSESYTDYFKDSMPNIYVCCMKRVFQSASAVICTVITQHITSRSAII